MVGRIGKDSKYKTEYCEAKFSDGTKAAGFIVIAEGYNWLVLSNNGVLRFEEFPNRSQRDQFLSEFFQYW